MDTKDYEIVIILSQELNLTKAAEKLYTSQPSLTYRLNKIEEELGVKILNRKSNGIVFTKSGNLFVEFAEKMLKEYENLKKEIKIIDEEKNKCVNIGVSTTLAKYKIAKILIDFKMLFPEVEVSIFTGTSSSELINYLRRGSIDLALFRGENQWEDIKYVVGNEPYGIITNKKFSKKMIKKTPYIYNETKNSVKSKLYLEEWRKENLDGEVGIVKVDSIEASLDMVQAGLGWTVLPKIHMGNFPNLYFYPLKSSKGKFFTRETYLLARKEKLNEKGISTFFEYILKNKDKYFENIGLDNNLKTSK